MSHGYHTHIRPIHDRIVVRRHKAEEVSSGGIIIPDNAKEKPVEVDIVAVGSGAVLASGQVRPLDVKVGDVAYIGKYSGSEVKVNGEELLIIREDDVLGVKTG
jgi:chaperonin GroES